MEIVANCVESLENADRSGTTEPNPVRLNALKKEFQDAMKKGVRGIVEAGQVLNKGREELGHGQFTPWVVNHLKFDIWTAEKLRILAQHDVISNPWSLQDC